MRFDPIPVESSNIEHIGYDEDASVMRIWFQRNAIYDYIGVAREDFETLLSAESVGKAFHSIIKPKYKFQKVS